VKEWKSLTSEQKTEFFEKPWKTLAGLSQAEDWDYHSDSYRRPDTKYPILMNYMNFTFLRIQEEGKLFLDQNQSRACFNTGLQTAREEDIFSTFYRNEQAEQYQLPDWTLYGFFKGSSANLSWVRSLPEPAWYLEDPYDRVFDYRIDIEVNYDHILDDNLAHFPEILKNNPEMARVTLKGAIESARKRATRDWRVAVPQWFQGRVQLLLPLFMTSDERADLSLPIYKERGTDHYVARTVLPIDDAYNNARLLAQQHRHWLNP
jgi:hypothetical protein